MVKSSKKGDTLVEVLVALTIVIIMATGILSVHLYYVRSHNRIEQHVQLETICENLKEYYNKYGVVTNTKINSDGKSTSYDYVFLTKYFGTDSEKKVNYLIDESGKQIIAYQNGAYENLSTTDSNQRYQYNFSYIDNQFYIDSIIDLESNYIVIEGINFGFSQSSIENVRDENNNIINSYAYPENTIDEYNCIVENVFEVEYINDTYEEFLTFLDEYTYSLNMYMFIRPLGTEKDIENKLITEAEIEKGLLFNKYSFICEKNKNLDQLDNAKYMIRYEVLTDEYSEHTYRYLLHFYYLDSVKNQNLNENFESFIISKAVENYDYLLTIEYDKSLESFIIDNQERFENDYLLINFIAIYNQKNQDNVISTSYLTQDSSYYFDEDYLKCDKENCKYIVKCIMNGEELYRYLYELDEEEETLINSMPENDLRTYVYFNKYFEEVGSSLAKYTFKYDYSNGFGKNDFIISIFDEEKLNYQFSLTLFNDYLSIFENDDDNFGNTYIFNDETMIESFSKDYYYVYKVIKSKKFAAGTIFKDGKTANDSYIYYLDNECKTAIKDETLDSDTTLFYKDNVLNDERNLDDLYLLEQVSQDDIENIKQNDYPSDNERIYYKVYRKPVLGRLCVKLNKVTYYRDTGNEVEELMLAFIGDYSNRMKYVALLSSITNSYCYSPLIFEDWSNEYFGQQVNSVLYDNRYRIVGLNTSDDEKDYDYKVEIYNPYTLAEDSTLKLEANISDASKVDKKADELYLMYRNDTKKEGFYYVQYNKILNQRIETKAKKIEDAYNAAYTSEYSILLDAKVNSKKLTEEQKQGLSEAAIAEQEKVTDEEIEEIKKAADAYAKVQINNVDYKDNDEVLNVLLNESSDFYETLENEAKDAAWTDMLAEIGKESYYSEGIDAQTNAYNLYLLLKNGDLVYVSKSEYDACQDRSLKYILALKYDNTSHTLTIKTNSNNKTNISIETKITKYPISGSFDISNLVDKSLYVEDKILLDKDYNLISDSDKYANGCATGEYTLEFSIKNNRLKANLNKKFNSETDDKTESNFYFIFVFDEEKFEIHKLSKNNSDVHNVKDKYVNAQNCIYTYYFNSTNRVFALNESLSSYFTASTNDEETVYTADYEFEDYTDENGLYSLTYDQTNQCFDIKINSKIVNTSYSCNITENESNLTLTILDSNKNSYGSIATFAKVDN